MHSPLSHKLALDNASVALVLQGGGALGAYQAGAFEEMLAVGVEPTWVAGVSIGAINGALIAGNAPEHRVDRLRTFWELVTSGPARAAPLVEGQRGAFNQWSAWWAATFGVPGFYAPRMPPPLLQPDGGEGAQSVYDNSALKSTLERLVDFDRINAGHRDTMRFSAGAVDVATGNSAWFDNRHIRIGPEHVMASGALPPAFAPVVIDDRSYWDGGIVSNTPLQYVLDTRPDERLLVMQVDLFPARGPVPTNLAGVLQRHKDILYSSRSRFTTEKLAEMQRLRGALRRLIRRLPTGLRNDDDLRALDATLHTSRVDIVHLIYRQSAFENASKDYEFSRPSMLDHWAAGVGDMRRTHQHLDWLEASAIDRDVTVYDLAQGFDAAPSSRDEPDHEEKTALVRASRKLMKKPTTPKKRASSSRKAPARSRS
jgi:NTE family protein